MTASSLTEAPAATIPTETIPTAIAPSPFTLQSPQFLVRTESPLGRLELTADTESILTLHIERAFSLPHDDLPERSNAVLDEAVRQLSEYFAGERTEFDLPLRMVGTAFQRDIWQQLQRVGWGEYVSYGELGLAAGRPGSGRAVGGAVGANPIPIIVGCHRVLASNNKITGYSGGNGIPTKVWLLDHESIGHL
ncbi:methylated-DNA--[protein]-cysteine S-methyltransferase [Subtercola lobariae]|uniref:Methylated-DNA--protein-cysteine methyltransferase n=1 Tax=Subtercola lobariae TaxID=1588641 RepID=A0A917EWJ9_9MICO|nr:methylated-DNA--[protein]-cysteine S-methyltransferase [Subtercola lobariae]GGF25543.1 methylated-DNA--protein-cysteine methyltransferase [Subtercola lobariae]